jgi:pSer/pThr/pTyr-binding forkhead associated (FHA) protein
MTRELVALAKKVDEDAFVRQCSGLYLLAERSELELPKKNPTLSTTKLSLAFQTAPMPPAAASSQPSPGGFAIIAVVRAQSSPFADMVSVGRSMSNDIVIRNSTVSKLHACFKQPAPGDWLLEDHGSSNGTWIEGVRLEPAKAVPLQGDEMVAFGECHVALKKGRPLWRFLERVGKASS